MILEKQNLEKAYQNFVRFLKTKGEDFKSFASSPFIDRAENYKYEVSKQAKVSLGQQFWKPADIGTGKIQENVKDAIKTRLLYKYEYHDNNLVDWRKKDDFGKLSKSGSLETTLFNFYKSKTSNSSSFEEFLNLGLSYQLIAYLFFIKNSEQFLPITQVRFDQIFEIIGLPEFKTSGRASWDNYQQFIDIVKQTRQFLKTKDPNVTLLDAHSFLYILGSQMKEANFVSTSTVEPMTEESTVDRTIESDFEIGVAPEIAQEEAVAVSNDIVENETFFADEILAEEIPPQFTEQLFEGAKRTIVVNAYERSSRARRLCIEHWKAICGVCDFDFEKIYGELGRGFIHVHHLTPVSKIGQQYEVDPINDLRPVCPNCHSMLHRQEKTLTISELKLIVVASQEKIVVNQQQS